MSSVNSTKKLYDDNEQEESEQEIGENENESSNDVHNNNTNEMTRIRTEEFSKKANPQTATELEQKTSNHATMRREKWWRQIFNEIIKQNEFFSLPGVVQNCSRQYCAADHTHDSTKYKRNIRRNSEALTKEQIILRRTERLTRNATSGESKCGQRQSTS